MQNTAELRNHAKKTIEELSKKKIKVAIDFLNYLQEKHREACNHY